MEEDSSAVAAAAAAGEKAGTETHPSGSTEAPDEADEADASRFDAALSARTAAIRSAGAHCSSTQADRLLRALPRSESVSRLMQQTQGVVTALEELAAQGERTASVLVATAEALSSFAS